MGASEAESAPPHADADELPQHPVEITRDFHLSKFEITVGQFREFVEATSYQTDAEKYLGDSDETVEAIAETVRTPVVSWRYPAFEQEEDHPVVNVSWNDATQFCDWLKKQSGRTFRLPTEAEWEYACRGKTQSLFSFGDDLTKVSEYANIA